MPSLTPPRSDEERAAPTGGQSWLTVHEVFAIREEVAPGKIEVTYSDEHDRQMSQETMRVIRRERSAKHAPAVTIKPVGTRTARSRERRPVTRRRPSSSSRTASQDPGDPDSEPPRRGGDPRHFPQDGAAICCPHCGQPLHERGGAHCGGCRITWWEGVR